MSRAPERTALYRIRGEGGELLYIGITNGVPFRWNGHQKVQPWWDELRTLTVEWHASREEAEAAEKAAIRAEQPKYNVTHLKPGRGRGKQGRPAVPVEHGLAVIEPRDDDEDLLDEQDIATMIRLQVGQVFPLLKRAGGPKGFTLGRQRVYRKGEIRQWIADIEASQRGAA